MSILLVKGAETLSMQSEQASRGGSTSLPCASVTNERSQLNASRYILEP
jgi:hypothetical protein